MFKDLSVRIILEHYQIYKIIRLGGLDLSRSCLDRMSQSRQFKKWHLNKSWQSLCYKVSICLNFYLCLDRDSPSGHFKDWHLDYPENLDSLKTDISDNLDLCLDCSQCWDPQAKNYLLPQCLLVWRSRGLALQNL